MKERKSMRGVSVDLGKLMSQQEKNIAVGNTKSNARGDLLGRAGRVVRSADELAREHYNKNNPNAVKQTTLKVDGVDMDQKLEEARVAAPKAAAEDDWQEPTPETAQEVADIMEAAEAAVEDSVEEDEWVEDADGNFVRKSELEDDKPVSKSKTSRKKR
jgi:hypothetical protein